jgi:anti-sigma B factor antagonist
MSVRHCLRRTSFSVGGHSLLAEASRIRAALPCLVPGPERSTVAYSAPLRYAHSGPRYFPQGHARMSLSHYTKDGILTVVFDDARILDEVKLEKVGSDLIELLNKTTEERVILDFRNVKFMTSSMLGKLVQVHKKASEFKVKLKFCSIDPEIRQVFKITKLDKLFDIESDETAARAAFMKRGWFG